MIRLGYACVNTRLPAPNRTCRLAHASPDRLLHLARGNLAALERILQWNAARGIRLFRIASETIPFASHPVHRLPWWRLLRPELARVAEGIRRHRMRVSMHPGQFTVLNSPRPEVVRASLAELDYHARLLDALGLDRSHKVIVHLGGAFGDRGASLRRFVRACRRLPAPVRRRLVLEHDEHNYTVADALEAARETGLPMVFDLLHHRCLPSLPGHSVRRLLRLAAGTWGPKDGRPKVHYAEQAKGGRRGAHARSVSLPAFRRFLEAARGLRLDVMLEVKDKEQSVLRILRALPAAADGGGR